MEHELPQALALQINILARLTSSDDIQVQKFTQLITAAYNRLAQQFKTSSGESNNNY